MASKIVPGNIDGTYPKAGQDNSSQGFRDNFSAIKNNFTEAKSEIDSLQLNKASLNSSSDFNDNEVLKANFKDTSEVVFAHGTTGGAITLNHSVAHYQTITTNASVIIKIHNTIFPCIQCLNWTNFHTRSICAMITTHYRKNSTSIWEFSLFNLLNVSSIYANCHIMF